MFIQTEATPNPATLKFLPARSCWRTAPSRRGTRGAAALAAGPRPVRVPGVSGVYLGHDFISVTKAEGEPGWPQVKPAVLGAIMEHFMSGAPRSSKAGHAPEEPPEEFYEEADADTVATIKDLLETRVRPAVAGDGGDITFRGFPRRRGGSWR